MTGQGRSVAYPGTRLAAPLRRPHRGRDARARLVSRADGGELPETVPPLLGWTVAVTAGRRGADLVALLQQRGAHVIHAPAVRVLPLQDEGSLQEATHRCLAAPFDLVVVTTGVGFGAWLDAADGWGLGTPLREALARAEVFARGPKASGAVHAHGLRDATTPPCESTWELLERLLSRDLRGRRIAVQLPGAQLGDFTRALRTAGADVVEVPVYRTSTPADDGPLQRLIDQVLTGEVHAVTFTSAAAANNLIAAASSSRRLDALLDAFRETPPVCVGTVAAAPLQRLLVSTVEPDQARIGAMVHAVISAMESRAVCIRVADRDLEVRGNGALVDGVFKRLTPVPMTALRVLARDPGRVASLAQLRRALPGAGDDHAVEMAISRLRAGLHDTRLVMTVMKRGYRLAYDLRCDADDAVENDVETAELTAPLLQSVGGTPGIRDIVERLYGRLLDDPLLAHHFADVDMPRLKRHQVLLLSQMLGGPAQYTGRDLATAHAPLSITAAEYDGLITHLCDVLRELAVEDEAIATIVSALAAAGEHIVNSTGHQSTPQPAGGWT